MKEENNYSFVKNSKLLWIYKTLAGVASGLLNGLFGSGGGVIAVMFLRKITQDEKKSHATATLMILIMSIASIILYSLYGHVPWKEGVRFVPGGLIGAVAGGIFLKNLNPNRLKRLFGLILMISGVLMLIL